MSRVYNFSAGPAALPLEVLQQVQDDIPNWQNTGMSVMECSHRSKGFVELAERSEANFRRLLSIPDDYSVIFPQGGATMQMAMTPLNISAAGDRVDYVVTGSWGKKAAGDAADASEGLARLLGGVGEVKAPGAVRARQHGGGAADVARIRDAFARIGRRRRRHDARDQRDQRGQRRQQDRRPREQLGLRLVVEAALLEHGLLPLDLVVELRAPGAAVPPVAPARRRPHPRSCSYSCC